MLVYWKIPIAFINRYSASYESQMVAAPSGHEPSYITRHVTGAKGSAKDEGGEVMRRTGFLWSWNHMIPNKKWKSLVIAQTDDLFQLKMLRDFKEFCANADQRLVSFWESCWELKEKASLERTWGACESVLWFHTQTHKHNKRRQLVVFSYYFLFHCYYCLFNWSFIDGTRKKGREK